MPIIDCLEFHSWASDIFLDGKFLWAAVQNHPPLYAYFVALVYSLLGYSTFAVAFVQYVMFSISTVLIYLIAAKLFNRITGLICCIIMTFYWFFIYMQSFLYSENLAIFLNIFLIYYLLFIKDTPKKFFIAGLIFGFSAICRTEILLFTGFILFWFLSKEAIMKKAVRLYCIFICGLLLVLTPVLVRNYTISHSILLRSQLGANLYIGNNADFKGTNIYIEIGKSWADFDSMPNKALKKDVSVAEYDRYFINETKKIISEHPLNWLKLILSKAAAIWLGREFLRTEDVYIFNRYILNRPYFRLIPLSAIFLFAIIGLIFSHRMFKRLLLVYLFILSGMVIIFFPIKTRYIMPIMPFLIPFSAFGVFQVCNALKKKQISSIMVMATVIVVFFILSSYTPLRPVSPDASETYYAIAKNYTDIKDYDKAQRFFLACLSLNPNNLSAMNDFGAMLMCCGKNEEALKYFEKAIEADSTYPLPRLNRDCLVKKQKTM